MDLSLRYLLASLVGFVLGPLFYSYFSKRRTWNQWMDGFSITSIGGIVLLHLLPELVEKAGLWAILFVILVILGPSWLEKTFLHRWKPKENFLLLLGMFLHSLIESAALGTVKGDSIDQLGLAIVLHRFPMGMILFSFFTFQKGKLYALGVILSLFLTSLLGFFLGSNLDSLVSPFFSVLLEVFVSASLLHVAFDHNHSFPKREIENHTHEHHTHEHHTHEHKERIRFVNFGGDKFYQSLGAVTGIALVAIVMGKPNISSPKTTYSLSFLDTFLTLSLESAPALLLGYFLAGILKSVFPESGIHWLKKGNRFTQSCKGVGFGLPLPVCSCGVLPIYESLVKKGIPVAASIGFLIATPELGIDALLLSIPLLGKKLTIFRLLVALLVAFFVSLIMSMLVKGGEEIIQENVVKEELSIGQKIEKGLEFGFMELFDHTIPWILIGLFMAAVMEPVLDYASFSKIPSFAQVPVMALVGIPFYVCATGATPLAAIAIHKGISAGAAIAFLISGPATNITTFGVISKLYNKRTALYFGISVTGISIVSGWFINYLDIPVLEELHTHNLEESSWSKILSLWILCILFVLSLFRQGPRGLIRQVLQPIHSHS